MLEFDSVEAYHIAEMAKVAIGNIDCLTEHVKENGYEDISRSFGRDFTGKDVLIMNIQRVLVQDIHDRATDFCGRFLWPEEAYAMVGVR